jgi:hypothetical protein
VDAGATPCFRHTVCVGALAFWKRVVDDRSNFLERVVALLEENGVRYCVIGGVAVNAYAEPVITQDMDLVVAAADLARTRALMEREFRVREFAPSLNVYDPGSKLQVQFQLEPEFEGFVDRAERHDVLGLELPVAAPRDLLRAKVAAATEPRRRASKRLKDLLDLARLVSTFPALRFEVPQDVMARIEEFVDK